MIYFDRDTFIFMKEEEIGEFFLPTPDILSSYFLYFSKYLVFLIVVLLFIIGDLGSDMK